MSNEQRPAKRKKRKEKKVRLTWELGELGSRPYDKAWEKQMEYDPAGKTFKARCAICGKEKTQKKGWFARHERTVLLLRYEFAYCDTCNRWVCEDCFLIDDGNGNSIGICTDCAKEKGIAGLTEEQFAEALENEK